MDIRKHFPLSASIILLSCLLMARGTVTRAASTATGNPISFARNALPARVEPAQSVHATDVDGDISWQENLPNDHPPRGGPLGWTGLAPVGKLGFTFLSGSSHELDGTFRVTATSPMGNGLVVSNSAVISVTFSQAISQSTVSARTFTVRGEQTGVYQGAYAFGSVQFDATDEFRPGEELVVTLSDSLRAEDGTALAPHTWSFRAAVGGGSGFFFNSGQSLGHSHSMAVGLGDLDGDGDLDAFVVNDAPDELSGAPNKVWLNDGQGNFSDSGQSLGNSSSHAVALGDLDSDGDLDAFVGNWSGPDKVWLNNGAGVFYDSGQELANFSSRGVALGDVDGDGDLDAFVAHAVDEANFVWLNDGDGAFDDSGQRLGSRDSNAVALGDLDGDGDLDAFVANSSAQTDRVWLNDGVGNFQDSGQALGISSSTGLMLGDLDGDGDLDAFVATSNNEPDRIWRNHGAGIFVDTGQRLGSSNNPDVGLGDLDGDGDLDAFVADGDSAGNRVWRNDGTGRFFDSGQFLGYWPSGGVALGDLDGDGDLDAFSANVVDHSNRVWLNRDRFFVVHLPTVLGAPVALLPPTAPTLYDISNEDGNGNYTLAWSAAGGMVNYLLEEDDNAAFSSPTTVYTGPDTAIAVSGRDVGTYYYRVKASNALGSSEWSNVQSVVVSVGCPQAGSWSDADGYPSFSVVHEPQCQVETFKIKTSVPCTKCLLKSTTTTFTTPLPIEDNHFEAHTSTLDVEGDFTSPTTVAGTWSSSYYDFLCGSCSGSGSWTASYNP